MLFLFSLLTIASYGTAPKYVVTKVYYNDDSCGTPVAAETKGVGPAGGDYPTGKCAKVMGKYEKYECQANGKLKVSKFETLTTCLGSTGSGDEYTSDSCKFTFSSSGTPYSTKYLFDCTNGAKPTAPAISGAVGLTTEQSTGVTGTACPGTGGTVDAFQADDKLFASGTCVKTGSKTSMKGECLEAGDVKVINVYTYSDQTCATKSGEEALGAAPCLVLNGKKTQVTFVGCSSSLKLSVAFALLFALFSF